MPRGVPRLGQATTTEAEELTEAPKPELLGTINPEKLNLSESPPPWETSPAKRSDNTDARRFVEVPDHWELRWVNPRLVEQSGWRYWQPVMWTDPQVKVNVEAMKTTDGNVRRGHGGDLLAWMPRHWYESRLKIKKEKADKQRRAAVDRHATFQEEVRRGHYGPYVKPAGSGIHPTHTIGDGRTMKDE